MRTPVVWLTLLFVMGVLWAGSNSVVKMGLGSIDPLALVFWRFAVAFAVLAIWIAIKRYSLRIGRGDLLRIGGAGLLLASSNLLWVAGIGMSRASDASLLYVFEPVWGILLASIILKEKLRATTIVGLLFVLLGLAVLSGFNAGAFGLKASGSAVGNLLVVAGLICEGLYSIVLKPLAARVSAPVVTAGNLAVAAAVTAIPMGLRGGFSVPSGAGALFSIAYLSIICTVIGYTLWVAVMKHAPVGLMLFTVFIQPIAGPLIAAGFLGEHLDAHLLLGGAPLIIGMFIAVAGHLRGERRNAAMSNAVAISIAGGV
ncbi:MAG: DMT family transporter [Pseudomonadota bacterium]